MIEALRFKDIIIASAIAGAGFFLFSSSSVAGLLLMGAGSFYLYGYWRDKGIPTLGE